MISDYLRIGNLFTFYYVFLDKYAYRRNPQLTEMKTDLSENEFTDKIDNIIESEKEVEHIKMKTSIWSVKNFIINFRIFQIESAA